MNPAVAFLVYPPYRKRRADNSFEGNDNFGAKVVEDAIKRAGIPVGRCSPETAHKYRIVLVSFHSTYDILAFYHAVALYRSWQARTFTAIGGGFGMQNPIPIRNLLDYAVFGRGEDIAVEMVKSILGGGVYNHPSVMNLPDITGVIMHQRTECYPHTVNGFREQFMGCPLKCKFCHYTFARDRVVTKGLDPKIYVQNTAKQGATPELLWRDIKDYELPGPRKMARLRTAIDGFSQRIRYLYGKRISNAQIIEGIEILGSHPGGGFANVYNISNFPGETEADRAELKQVFAKAKPRNRVIIVLHTTPFRPSPLTPMQWEGANLDPDISKWQYQTIFEGKNLKAVHQNTLEGPWSHFVSLLCERATPESDKAFQAVALSRVFRRGHKIHPLAVFEHNFDMTPYLREYEIGDPAHPTAFLTGGEKVEKTATKMRSERWD